MPSWFYVQNGQTQGPVDDNTLRALAQQGTLNANDYVMGVGESSWRTMGAIEAQLGLTRDSFGGYRASSLGPPTGMAPPMGTAPPSSSIPPPPGYASTYTYGTPFAGTIEYAGWWSRVAALIIDSLILAVPFVILVAIFVDFDDLGAGAVPDFGGGLLALILVSLILGGLYFGYFHSNSGQTLGKKALGIKVVTADGHQLLTFWRAVGRYAFTQVLGQLCNLFPIVDYLWPLWDQKKQALHDKVLGSIVIKA